MVSMRLLLLVMALLLALSPTTWSVSTVYATKETQPMHIHLNVWLEVPHSYSMAASGMTHTPNIHTYIHTYILTDIHIGRQADRQTDIGR
jgi:hypothetical protein